MRQGPLAGDLPHRESQGSCQCKITQECPSMAHFPQGNEKDPIVTLDVEKAYCAHFAQDLIAAYLR